MKSILFAHNMLCLLLYKDNFSISISILTTSGEVLSGPLMLTVPCRNFNFFAEKAWTMIIKHM